MDSRMQLLLTSDGRPIIQHINTDEAIVILRAFGGYPVRAPKPMPIAWPPAAPHRPEQPSLGLDVPATAPAAPAASATPVAVSPPPVPASALAPPATEAHPGKHGAGRHPEGYAEIALVVDQLTAGGKPLQVRRMATKLGISGRQVVHLLDRTRGTSPVVLAKIRELACNVLGIAACTQYDWPAMARAVAARSRRLPRALKQTMIKPEGA